MQSPSGSQRARPQQPSRQSAHMAASWRAWCGRPAIWPRRPARPVMTRHMRPGGAPQDGQGPVRMARVRADRSATGLAYVTDDAAEDHVIAERRESLLALR